MIYGIHNSHSEIYTDGWMTGSKWFEIFASCDLMVDGMRKKKRPIIFFVWKIQPHPPCLNGLSRLDRLYRHTKTNLFFSWRGWMNNVYRQQLQLLLHRWQLGKDRPFGLQRTCTYIAGSFVANMEALQNSVKSRRKLSKATSKSDVSILIQWPAGSYN